MKAILNSKYPIFTTGLLLFLRGCAVPERDSRKSLFYINPNEYPLYEKNGFNPADIAGVPDKTDGPWLTRSPGSPIDGNGQIPSRGG